MKAETNEQRSRGWGWGGGGGGAFNCIKPTRGSPAHRLIAFLLSPIDFRPLTFDLRRSIVDVWPMAATDGRPPLRLLSWQSDCHRDPVQEHVCFSSVRGRQGGVVIQGVVFTVVFTQQLLGMIGWMCRLWMQHRYDCGAFYTPQPDWPIDSSTIRWKIADLLIDLLFIINYFLFIIYY